MSITRYHDDERLKALQKFREKFAPNDFLEKFGYDSILKSFSDVRTIKQAVRLKHIIMYEVSMIYSKEFSIDYISIYVMRLQSYLGFESKLSEDQIQEISILLYDNLFGVSVIDVFLFFKLVKTGVYGLFYGRIDPMLLVKWSGEFCSDRRREIYKKNEKEEQERKLKEYDESCKRISLLSNVKNIISKK